MCIRDRFHHWREPSFGRAELERAFAAAGVRILEDTAITLSCGVRIVGRKDHLYTNGNRFTAAQLMPTGPDDRYTVWLDHEPRDFKNAAAAGADLILSGHTHGGQLIPLVQLIRWFHLHGDDAVYGQERRGDTDFLVTSGISDWAILFKTGCRSEYVIIEIQGT